MVVKFWGVRGSCPSPLTSMDVKKKIELLLEKIRPDDLESSRSKEIFLSSLPEDIYGTAGGNTSCVEVRLADNSMLVFDCGTGLRELYKSVERLNEGHSIEHYHIFFSHFHYDHLLGLPYFSPLYDSSKKVSFYSPYRNMERILKAFLSRPFHPVGFDSFQARVEFIVINSPVVPIGNAQISWIKRDHPDGTMAYKVKENNKSMVYSTDTELAEKDFEKNDRNKMFFQDVDMIVLDSQYTLKEAIEKSNWGHSSFSLAIEFVNVFRIKKLFLFHHEPMNDDSDVMGIEQQALKYQHHISEKHSDFTPDIQLAKEGVVIEL